MSIISDGSYGVAKGIFFSFPVRCDYGRYNIVRDLEQSEFAKEMLKNTEKELLEERESVKGMLPEETREKHENLSICVRSGHTLFDESFTFPDVYLSANRVE